MTIVAAIALVSVLAFVALTMAGRRPTPFHDEAGSPLPERISEKIHVHINGARQGMFIKGRDVSNPVLLYLHGGMPDFFLSARYPTGLDEYFVVVWWEQRGSGLSYNPGMSSDGVTTEQLVDDTIAVTNYLRTRFKRDKIYLMGHSGGTFIGVQAAASAPDLYHAYIGVGQMSYQLKSEQLAYAYMLRRFREEKNERMVRRLEAAPVGDSAPLPDGYMSVRDVAMHKLGIGTTHDMRSIVTGLVLPSLLSREYTLREKINLWRGKIFSGKRLWATQLATDLTKTVTRFRIPIYFLHGEHDYTASYAEARTYYRIVDAPVKGFYTFHHSAHSPMFEEPAWMREIMHGDVLRGTTMLADE